MTCDSLQNCCRQKLTITRTIYCFSLGKQRPVLSQVGEKSIPERGHRHQTPSCKEDHSGTATPDPEEGAASSGFVAINLSPVLQEGDSQEWVMLELEQGSASGATKPPGEVLHEDKPGTLMPAETENQSSEPQDGQCTAVPSSPVLSQMSMPGTWLLGHRRLPGMLGQMPSVIMGRSQVDQVGVTKHFVVHELKADLSNEANEISCITVDKVYLLVLKPLTILQGPRQQIEFYNHLHKYHKNLYNDILLPKDEKSQIKISIVCY